MFFIASVIVVNEHGYKTIEKAGYSRDTRSCSKPERERTTAEACACTGKAWFLGHSCFVSKEYFAAAHVAPLLKD
jgi:hypothetical protein